MKKKNRIKSLILSLLWSNQKGVFAIVIPKSINQTLRINAGSALIQKRLWFDFACSFSFRLIFFLQTQLTRKWFILLSSESISRISSMSTSIASVWKQLKPKSWLILKFSLNRNVKCVLKPWSAFLTGGSKSFCNSSYSHISTANRFRIKLIWCDPYLAVRNFSRRSFTASPFSVKFTRKFVRFGDRSQSFIDCKLHCISVWVLRFREIMEDISNCKCSLAKKSIRCSSVPITMSICVGWESREMEKNKENLARFSRIPENYIFSLDMYCLYYFL